MSRARASRLTVIDVETGRALKKSHSVHAGQQLRALRPPPDADVVPPVPAILFQNDDLLVLNKPSGLAAHPTASRYRSTVTWWLGQRGFGEEPAHRLDVETSGVLICSRHLNADRALKAAFAERAVKKLYRAVVAGDPPDRWIQETPLGFDAASSIRLKMGCGEQPARTRFAVVERRPGRAIVEAYPTTGRQHQIRVHLTLSGTPIVGDKIYGVDESLFLASLERELAADEIQRLGHHRLALHAQSIEFELFGRPWCFEAEWPPELQALL